MCATLRNSWLPLLKSIFAAMGILWLPIEVYLGLVTSPTRPPLAYYLLFSLILGIVLYLFDGYILAGYLRKEIKITKNTNNTDLVIKFGDLFSQTGWKAMAVNDFFDSDVDEDLVSSKSLHGYTIRKYWGKETADWENQVKESIKTASFQTEERPKGNKNRYKIGTTAVAKKASNKFLFVALTSTGSDNVASATTANLILATREMLRKARTVCSNEPLSIPLMGSGLGRINIKESVLADLIITAILEESQASKVTSKISLILPKAKIGEFNLKNYANNWN